MEKKLIRRRMFKGGVALALAGALGTVTYIRATEDPPGIESIEDIERREGKSVLAVRLQEKEFDDYLRADASLRAPRRYEMRANISEKVENVMVEVGNAVEAGQLLLEFRKDDIQSDIEAAQARLDEAKKNFERFENLLERRVVSEDAVEARLTALQDARAALQKARSRLAFTHVRAPEREEFDYGGGKVRVSARSVDPGEFKASGQPLLTLTDMSVMDVEARLPERALKGLSRGMDMEFRLEHEQQWRTARLERISPATDDPHRFFTVYGRTGNVRTGGEWLLRTGMYAEVRIVRERGVSAVAVPAGALRIAGEGCCSVLLVEGRDDGDTNPGPWTGVVREVEIETGLRTEDWVEVRSPALTGEQRVILNPRFDIRHGDRVRVKAEQE